MSDLDSAASAGAPPKLSTGWQPVSEYWLAALGAICFDSHVKPNEDARLKMATRALRLHVSILDWQNYGL